MNERGGMDFGVSRLMLVEEKKMRSQTLVALGLLSISPWVASLQWSPHGSPARVPENLARAKRDAARTTYEVIWKNNREGFIPITEIAYRWSRRWLEAELELDSKKSDKIAAYQNHLERMRELSRITHERYRNRVNTVEEVSASDFYQLEARAWLEQAAKS
jgi:hypothetical protein